MIWFCSGREAGRMCGISLILSGIHVVSSSSNLFNGFQYADFGSSLQEGKWASGTVYPTVDDFKEIVSRRGPDHVGLERLQLKVVSGQEPRFRKGEQPIESRENYYILYETSYSCSEANEKLKTSSQMTSDSETRSSCFQTNTIESTSQEHINKYSVCSSDINQATKSSIVVNFVEGISGQTIDAFQENTFAEMLFVGATLQLRGAHPVRQPLVDSWKNVLVYNGEIFGGISVGKEENDTIILINALQRCCSCSCHASGRDCHCRRQKDHISVPQLLSTVKGPWSLIYWQAKSNIVWFGRDAFGRRSLLIHWPSLIDSRLLLSSVAPLKAAKKASCGSCGHKGAQHQTDDYIEEKEADGSDDLEFWDELACGIYSISLETGKGFVYKNKDLLVSIVGKVEKHDWCSPQVKKLLNWERCFVDPGSNDSLLSKFTCSHVGDDTFYSKENGLISSVIEEKEVKLGYVEYFDQSLMKSRTATEDNQENKKMIYRTEASQLLIDQGLESEANQILEGTDCFSLSSFLQQNNSKTKCFIDTIDSHTPLLSHKVQLDTIKEDIHSSSTSMESPGLREMKTRILQESFTSSAQRVLFALKKAVLRRTCQSQFNQIREGEESIEKHVPIAILFSGGLDSMILAALLNQCLDRNCEIDLLNVSFDGPHAPDRISAKAGLAELQRIAAFRRWHLVEIDADPSNLQPKMKYLTSVIHPAKTYMDLNIGTALWLAACGDGWVEEEEFPQGGEKYQFKDSYLLCTGYKKSKRTRYKSEARILFIGSGADEQCAGYGRHKTKFRLGGWVALQEEMKIDVQRLWKRNLGRDDRCIGDHGKEARFPFLDEDVIETLLDLPLWEIADLEKPSGQGDKKILRQVAQLLGLEKASTIPKRAIQFGSRIARESNRRNFGSNRAANQASAGSAVIHCLTE